MKTAYRILSCLVISIMTCHVSLALEVELSISTELLPSEVEAYQTSKQLSTAIVSGKNEEALAEAFLECPEDNMPEFKVNSIHLNSAWLMNAKSVEDKRYSGIINYILTCKHDRRRGGDR